MLAARREAGSLSSLSALALRLLGKGHGFAHFPRPRHPLRADFAHSPPDRGHQDQRWLGVRSISPLWSPILSAQLSGGSAQFVLFPSGNPVVCFWLCHLPTTNEVAHAQNASNGRISAAIKANSRVCDGKTGRSEKPKCCFYADTGTTSHR